MLSIPSITNPDPGKLESAIFLTFSGNCKEALTFYQQCFGGKVHLDFFDKSLHGYPEKPVVSGSLISESIIIHGSDLVPNEGRISGNHIALFMQCSTHSGRKLLIKKLLQGKAESLDLDYAGKLIEIRDDFDIRWVLGV